MATLQAVGYSMNGEPLQKNKLGKDFTGLVTYPLDEITKKPIYPAGKKWYVFKLVDSNKKGGVRISNIDDVKNPETGKVERARLLSGVESIWQREQKEVTKEYAQMNWVELRFFRNQKMLRISEDNPLALYFLRISNSNVGNPLRVKGSRHEYYEYDSAVAEQEAYEKENFELEMALEAKAAKPDAMRKHAAFLGISLTNSQGEQKTDDGVRKDYVMYAKRNPAYFKQTMSDKAVEISWLVRTAISEGFIDVGREMGKVFWAKGGGMIGVYPQTQNAQDYLTDLANTNSDDGIRFKEQLKQYIK